VSKKRPRRFFKSEQWEAITNRSVCVIVLPGNRLASTGFSASRDGRAFCAVETEPYRAGGGSAFIQVSPDRSDLRRQITRQCRARPHKEAGPGMEPAKCRETAVKAARLPSGLCRKPASDKAGDHTTLDHARASVNDALVGIVQ
jgi:hypothetical protein